MLDAAITAERILVSASVEKAEIKRLLVFFFDDRQVNLAFVNFRVIVVRVVATQSANVHSSVFVLPFIDRKQDESFRQV